MPQCRFSAVVSVRVQSRACLLGGVAMLTLLSACGSQPQRISAQQESTQYLSHARRSYTPPGPASDPWGPYITEAAAKFDVPERWVREVMRQESGGNLYGRGGGLITSGAGAMGLMQVMPATYDELKGRYPELGRDPFDPHNNILAGTAYIREMYDIYGSPGFLAAYNAGPGRLDDYLTRSRSLPLETRRYVASIGPRIAGTSPNTRSPGEQYAMNALPVQIPDGPRYANSAASGAESASYSPALAAALSTPSASSAVTRPIVLSPPSPIVLSPPSLPVQVAQAPETPPAAAPGNYIVLAPQPPESADFADASTAEPPEVVPSRPRQAQRPEPAFLPRQERPAVAGRTRAVEPPRQFAALAPAPQRPSAFSLVSPANAAPVVLRHAGPVAGNWAVQVGAFENASMASAATAAARATARDVLGGARPAVSSVRQPRGTLYRARLVGLSRDAAAHACERLVRVRTNCMIVSPDAQS